MLELPIGHRMLRMIIIPVIPVVLLPISLFFFEYLAQSKTLRQGLCWICVSCAVYTVLNPPSKHPLINWVNGFFSVVHIARYLELLFVYDPRLLYRVKQAPVSSIYQWEGFLPLLSTRRLIWVADLTFNIRAIGWSHGSDQFLPHVHPGVLQKGSLTNFRVAYPPWALDGDRWRLFLKHVSIISRVYLWFDAYHFVTDPRIWNRMVSKTGIPLSSMVIQELHGWVRGIGAVISLIFFLHAVHTSVTLVAVCIFGTTFLGAWGEPWAYPPLFKEMCISTLNIQGWTRFPPLSSGLEKCSQ